MSTLATCWKITRRDTVVEGYTDHDVDLIVDAVTYRSAVGYAPSAVERTTALEANNQQVTGIIDHVNLTDSALRNGTYNGARCEIFQVDWTNPAAGAVRTLLVGHLGAVEIHGSRYTVELRSIENELTKPALRIFSSRCDADLGDARCGVTVTPATGSVTSVTSARRVFVDTSRTEPNDHYTGGKVTFTSGANNGRIMDVKKYTLTGTVIELYEPMPDDIAITDTYQIVRGCDKTLATCRDVFANVVNHRGFPHVPGVSDLVGGGT